MLARSTQEEAKSIFWQHESANTPASRMSNTRSSRRAAQVRFWKCLLVESGRIGLYGETRQTRTISRHGIHIEIIPNANKMECNAKYHSKINSIV